MVSHYGLIPTIADLTKGGKKVYDDAGKNFAHGFAMQTDNAKVEGMLAFRNSSDIRNSDAILYKTLYYAATETDIVTVIPTESLLEVTQMFHDTAVVYVPYNGGFVDKSKIASLSINDQFKLFQPGSIILIDKTELTGEVAQILDNQQEYCTRIKFKGVDGMIKEYGVDDIRHFHQTIKNEEYHYSRFEGLFVRLLFNGNTFTFYKNPHPKTINKRATDMARSAAALAGSIGSAATVNSMKGVSNDNKAQISNSINTSSAAELSKTSNDINKVKESGMVTNKTDQQNLNKAQAAVVMQGVGNEMADNLVIYNVEYYIFNKKTGDNKLMIKADFGDNIEPLLKSCEKYLFLSKSEQKKCKDFDNAISSLKMVDDCYK